MKPAPLTPSDLRFEGTLDFGQTLELTEALSAALSAMASYGSDFAHRSTIATLMLVAQDVQAHALRNREQKS